MIGKELLGFGVHHVDFSPVAAAAADGVGGIFAVFRLEYAGEGHSPVVAELVGVEEHLALG